MDQAAIMHAIFEELRIGIEKRPSLKVQAAGESGLALGNTPRSITVCVRMSSEAQRIMIEYQHPDELTGVLMKKPDTIDIRLAEDGTPYFVHKGTELDLKRVAQFLIEAAEGSGGF